MEDSQRSLTEKKEKKKAKLQRGYIVVHAHRCKGCDLCIPVCPVDIIVKAGPERVNWMGWTPVAVEGMEYCLACNLCAMICPDQAIEVFKFAKPIPHEVPA